ncbi:hypothetical protein EDD16DRAFT_1661797 [Pisolithus croceorrhizus]|nr:hypothetical protein EDD16DRAFT_1661797 [Pisolithus croceorrhizus]
MTHQGASKTKESSKTRLLAFKHASTDGYYFFPTSFYSVNWLGETWVVYGAYRQFVRRYNTVRWVLQACRDNPNLIQFRGSTPQPGSFGCHGGLPTTRTRMHSHVANSTEKVPLRTDTYRLMPLFVFLTSTTRTQRWRIGEVAEWRRSPPLRDKKGADGNLR